VRRFVRQHTSQQKWARLCILYCDWIAPKVNSSFCCPSDLLQRVLFGYHWENTNANWRHSSRAYRWLKTRSLQTSPDMTQILLTQEEHGGGTSLAVLLHAWVMKMSWCRTMWKQLSVFICAFLVWNWLFGQQSCSYGSSSFTWFT